MGQIKGLWMSVTLCVGLIGWLYPVPGYGHSLPSHVQLTDATVKYLQENANKSPKLTCTSKDDATHLRDLLRIGTIQEDDWFNPAYPVAEMGRFVFHFTPASSGGINNQFVKSQCSSLDWSGLATPNVPRKDCSFLWANQNHTRSNVHTWGAAIAGAKRKLSDGQVTRAIVNNHAALQHAKTNAKAIEASGAAEGWITVGYLLHLFQDMSSPAHTHDLAHGHALGPLGMKDWGTPDPLEADTSGAERAMTWRDFTLNVEFVEGTPAELFNRLRDEVTKRYPKATWEHLQTQYRHNYALDAGRTAGRVWEAITLPGIGLAMAIGEHITEIKGREHFLESTQKAYQHNLAPLAVRYGASFLAHYIKTHQPLLPGSCKFQ